MSTGCTPPGNLVAHIISQALSASAHPLLQVVSCALPAGLADAQVPSHATCVVPHMSRHVPNCPHGELEAVRDHVLGRRRSDSDEDGGWDDDLLAAAQAGRDEQTDEDKAFTALGASAQLDQVIFDGASFGTGATPGTPEEEDYRLLRDDRPQRQVDHDAEAVEQGQDDERDAHVERLDREVVRQALGDAGRHATVGRAVEPGRRGRELHCLLLSFVRIVLGRWLHRHGVRDHGEVPGLADQGPVRAIPHTADPPCGRTISP